MPPTPAITFLLCTRNRAEVARECVLNLLNSSRTDIEVIVRDNASTDDTVELLLAIQDPRLRTVVAPSNQGTMNFFEIAKLARGSVVTWLSDEDNFQFEHLDFVLDRFRLDPACDVLLSSIVVGPAARTVRFADETITDPVRASIVALSFSGCGGLFVRRVALAKAHAFAVGDLDDAYALWNFYPVGFFATRAVTDRLNTTSRIAVAQARFAATTNNWSETTGSVEVRPRPPHYYPESAFDRLASNLANVWFKPMPWRTKFTIAVRLIRSFRLHATWYADPSAHDLLRENYPRETVERFLAHIRAMNLEERRGQLLWFLCRLCALPFRLRQTLRHWRRLGARSVAA